MTRPTLGTTTARDAVPIDRERLIETRPLLAANSGGGKPWAIRRLLEQTHGHVQHPVIDLEDGFHTLRERYDYMLAGRQHDDCATDPRHAALLARPAAIDHPLHLHWSAAPRTTARGASFPIAAKPLS